MFQFFKNLLSGPSYESIDETQFRKMYRDGKNVHLLDVRTPGEYASGHIHKAVNADIMSSGFGKTLSAYTHKSDVFLVYCRSGARSAAACRRLKKEGFEHVYNLRGGIAGWRGTFTL